MPCSPSPTRTATIIYNDSPFSKDELFSVQNGSARLSADGMQYQIDSSKSDAND